MTVGVTVSTIAVKVTQRAYAVRREFRVSIKLLKTNVNYSGRTAPLTSKVAFYIFIQQI